MGVDSAGGADSMVEDDEEGQFKAVVVEKSGIPPPEAPVGVVEGAEDADMVDEGVGSDFERLGSLYMIGVGVDGAMGDPPSRRPTASTPFTSGSSLFGRERASATKFAFPWT